MALGAFYPTPQHARAAQAATEFFAARPEPRAVLLTCSCARGQAAPDSCVDLLVLVPPEIQREALEQAWAHFYATAPVFAELRRVGKYAQIDLDLSGGRFTAPAHGWTTGPDSFELEIGNALAYSFPLWERDTVYQELKAQWLPYYAEPLRQERFALVRRYCVNNLNHIPGYVSRGLYFQSLHRLWHAFGEFLQALFIARRTYPIAYDKWIKEQVVEILGLPELYPQLTNLFEMEHFESEALTHKAAALETLLIQYLPESL